MAEQVASKVVAEVRDSLLTIVKKEIGYMWSSEENVKKLRSECEKLKLMKERVEKARELVRKNGDELLPGVVQWVDQAVDHITETEKFLQEEAEAEKTCFNCLPMCVNLRTLHHYGKEAINKVTSLEKHQKDGERFDRYKISIPIGSTEYLDLLRREIIDDLETHKSVLEVIIESVKSTQITGIWGVGGVGKTTLAIEVAARVKELFDLVVFVTVSRPLVAENIKKDVKEAVNRIKQGGKVLIIFDDVWVRLKLDEVGIPSCVADYPNFKILLTSRNIRVCEAMNAHKNICVDSLPIKEARILFKRVVGETDAKLEKVEEEIVKGCGGLPLIIQAVGKALKDKKEIKEWENARDTIQKNKTSDIDEDIELEFAHLRLSYDYLRSEDAKSIFLLCCMFPEDFDIPLELLAYYGIGLELFEEPYSLEDARNKVQRAVKILKSSCLLLDGKNRFGLIDGSRTKMHDVVREVALLIASKGENKFLVEAGKNLTLWEPRPGSLSYTGISLMGNDIRKLPAGYKLNIPLLKIFLIQRNRRLSEISDEFIQAVKEAEVLDFEYNNIISLPESLKQLKRLRMLNLGGNKHLCDVSILGELEDLEILILNGTGIKKIPQEIGKLDKLRLLHAAQCPHLSHIEPGVLANLRWLEELSIGYYQVEEGENNSLVEISKLSKLTYLHLWVPHICLIPEGDYLKRLKTFHIQIGGSEEFIIRACNKTLILKTLDDDISHLMHVRKWTEVCNGIFLQSINNLDKLDKIIMPMVYCEGFGFKTIYIGQCANLLYLVDSLDEMQTSFISSIRNHEAVKENILSEVEKLTLSDLSSLKVIWNCRDKYISLNNLVTLNIFECPKLEKLFTVSVAQGLINLQKLTIWWCNSLKEVILDGDGEASTSEIDPVVPPKNIVFHRLAEIRLISMESLTSFYPGNATIEYPSLVKLEIMRCYKMEKWGNETHDTPKLQFVEINRTEANDSTIVEAWGKYKEVEELRVKQRHDQRTEEGPALLVRNEEKKETSVHGASAKK